MFEEEMRLAWRRHQNSSWKEARDHYKIAISESNGRSNNEKGKAYFGLHSVLAAMNRLSEAQQAYNEAIRLNPELDLFKPDYNVESIVGVGGVSIVYKIRHKTTNGYECAKCVKQHLWDDIDGYKRDKVWLEEELSRLKILKQNNVSGVPILFEPVEVKKSISCFPTYYLRMELIKGFTLDKLLNDTWKKAGVEDNYLHRIGILQRVSKILSEMHRVLKDGEPVIHTDIKPANIIVNYEKNNPGKELFEDRFSGKVKLIDLAAQKLIDDLRFGASIMTKGSVFYMPIEMQVGDQQPTVKSDVYMLGATVYDVLAGRQYAPTRGEWHPPLPKNAEIDPIINDLLIDMLSHKQTDRPDMATVSKVLEKIEKEAQDIHTKQSSLLNFFKLDIIYAFILELVGEKSWHKNNKIYEAVVVACLGLFLSLVGFYLTQKNVDRGMVWQSYVLIFGDKAIQTPIKLLVICPVVIGSLVWISFWRIIAPVVYCYENRMKQTYIISAPILLVGSGAFIHLFDTDYLLVICILAALCVASYLILIRNKLKSHSVRCNIWERYPLLKEVLYKEANQALIYTFGFMVPAQLLIVLAPISKMTFGVFIIAVIPLITVLTKIIIGGMFGATRARSIEGSIIRCLNGWKKWIDKKETEI